MKYFFIGVLRQAQDYIRRTMALAIASLLLVCFSFSNSFSQGKIDSLLGKLDPQKFAESVGKKAEKMEDALVKKSEKVLSSMQKSEEKIYSKMLHGKDSLMAKMKLGEVKEKYTKMKDGLKNPVAKAKAYIPHLDSLSTSLKFLGLTLPSPGGEGVASSLKKVESLQGKFQQAEQIKKFIKERREQLKQQLEKLAPSSMLRMTKQLKQINKQVYYYAAQIKEYKEILKDPKKIEKKALELLSKTKFFQKFMKENSMLAGLFRMAPDNPNDPAYLSSLAGLQTRVQVNNIIQQQIQSGGANARQVFQQNMSAAQSQMNELKNKLLKLGGGGGSSDDIMPEGFKKNEQKTKSFLKRLEYGTNIQTQKGSTFFPNSSDIGLSLGYKLNDKSVIGVGASYKVGLGRGWNNIRFSSEGMGLRSYVDWKAPFGSPTRGMFKDIWISGGYEMNYKSAFNSVEQLKDYSAWQKSGLLGLSKSVPIKMKFFKKTKVQLLWDFLSYQQLPRTQPIIFRVNYNLK